MTEENSLAAPAAAPAAEPPSKPLLSWQTAIAAASVGMGAVPLHAIGSIPHNLLLGQFGMDADFSQVSGLADAVWLLWCTRLSHLGGALSEEVLVLPAGGVGGAKPVSIPAKDARHHIYISHCQNNHTSNKKQNHTQAVINTAQNEAQTRKH